MIHYSKKERDLAFIQGIISKNALSIVPVENYTKMPGYWDSNQLWSRSVERYPWGAIVFLRNEVLKAGATIVVQGELDVDSGVVISDTEPETLPVKWYGELAYSFAEKDPTMSDKDVPPPECLGYHQGDFVCDGGYNDQGQMEVPCAWRARCIATQMFCARVGKTPIELFEGKSAEMINLVSFKIHKDHGEVPAPPPVVPDAAKTVATVAAATPAPARKVASPATKAAPPKAPPKPVAVGASVSQSAIADGSTSMVSYQAIMDGLKVAFPGRRFVGDKDKAKVGDIYIKDRLTTSGYIGVYCAPTKGHAIGLFAFRFRATTPGVQLPFLVSNPCLEKVKANAIEWNDGGWHSEVKPVGVVVAVEDVVQILVDAINSGGLALPAPAK